MKTFKPVIQSDYYTSQNSIEKSQSLKGQMKKNSHKASVTTKTQGTLAKINKFYYQVTATPYSDSSGSLNTATSFILKWNMERLSIQSMTTKLSTPTTE